MGLGPMEHRCVKEFYQKVGPRCIMNSSRLKKASFHFKIPAFDKNVKIALYMYCADDERDASR